MGRGEGRGPRCLPV